MQLAVSSDLSVRTYVRVRRFSSVHDSKKVRYLQTYVRVRRFSNIFERTIKRKFDIFVRTYSIRRYVHTEI